MLRLRTFVLVGVFLVLLQGCATTKHNTPLANEFWQQSDQQKITIASYVEPIAALNPEGGVGLLDLAIINSANKKLNNVLKHYNYTMYHKLNNDFITELKKRNIKVEELNKPKLIDEKAEKSLIAQLGDGKLLVLQLVNIGITREYYGFIPRSYPQAFCVLQGKLVDINNNELWYHQAKIIDPIEGKWDQPPRYKNALKAIDRALSSARQELLDSFFSGH